MSCVSFDLLGISDWTFNSYIPGIGLVLGLAHFIFCHTGSPHLHILRMSLGLGLGIGFT